MSDNRSKIMKYKCNINEYCHLYQIKKIEFSPAVTTLEKHHALKQKSGFESAVMGADVMSIAILMPCIGAAIPAAPGSGAIPVIFGMIGGVCVLSVGSVCISLIVLIRCGLAYKDDTLYYWKI